MQVNGNADSHNEGVVMVAAEHVDAKNVTFMARQARGLVCLALTDERCRQLDLPPMVDDAMGEKSNFTLSIEASVGIDTGISADVCWAIGQEQTYFGLSVLWLKNLSDFTIKDGHHKAKKLYRTDAFYEDR